MAEAAAAPTGKPGSKGTPLGRIILGVSIGTVLAGLVLMGIRHAVVLIRAKGPAKPAPENPQS